MPFPPVSGSSERGAWYDDPQEYERTATITTDANSPSEPYITFTIGSQQLKRLVIRVWSCENGADGSKANPDPPNSDFCTYFSMGLVPKVGPQQLDSLELYEFLTNTRESGVVICHTLEWFLDVPYDGNDDDLQGWMESIACTPGSEVGIFPFSSYQGLRNTVFRMQVQLYHAQKGRSHSSDAEAPDISKMDDDGQETRYKILHYTINELLEHLSHLEREVERMQNVPTSAILNGTQAVRSAVLMRPLDLKHIAERLFELGNDVFKVFKESNPDLLIETWRQASKITPRDHPRLPVFWSRLGTYLWMRFARKSSRRDLDEAVHAKSEAVDLTPGPGILLAYCLSEFGGTLFDRYQHGSLLGDLDAAIEAATRAADLTSRNHPQYLSRKRNVCNYLAVRFFQTDSLDALDRSIEAGERLAAAIPPGAGLRSDAFDNLGVAYSWRYRRNYGLEDLDQALEWGRRAIAITPRHDPNLAAHAGKVGFYLCMRFGRTGSERHFAEALQATSFALRAWQSTPRLDAAVEEAAQLVKSTIREQEEAAHADCLSKLAATLKTRYWETRSVNDLDLSIELYARAAHITLPEHPDFIHRLHELGSSLLARGMNEPARGEWDDFDRAIDLFKLCVLAIPEDQNERILVLHTLEVLLYRRFRKRGSQSDLDEAIEAGTQAADAIPGDPVIRADILEYLVNALYARIQKKYSIDDITGAINRSKELIEVLPENEPKLIRKLSSLGGLLSMRGEQTGSTEDVDQAIDTITQAVELCASDNPDLPGCLANLGSSLARRYRRFSTENDLHQAIDVARQAISLTSRTDRSLPQYINSLGAALIELYIRTGSVDDLRACIQPFRDAFDIESERVEPDVLGLAIYLTNLSQQLVLLFRETKAKKHLDDATRAAEMAVDIKSKAFNVDGISFLALSNCYHEQFKHNQATDALEKAIRTHELAGDALPSGHNAYAGCLCNLGVLYEARAERSKLEEHRVQAREAFKKGWESSNSAPWDRLVSAKNASKLYAARSEWAAVATLSREALSLVAKVSPRYLKQSEVQKMLWNVAGMAAKGAAAALNAEESASSALSLLELGRGITASLSMDMREDTYELETSNPNQAKRLAYLREVLSKPMPPGISLREQASWAKRQHDADIEFSELLETIRMKPGFEDFLLAPQDRKLRETAEKGPIIVVNISTYRCDAFLVTGDKVDSLELTTLKEKEVFERLRYANDDNVVSNLRWLWETTCRPCLDKLGFDRALDTDWPRVFWIPTNGLGMLPLHAAGNYESDLKETVMDRVISSYALSIKALQHGRSRAARHCGEENALAHAVLVAMKTTPGQDPLPYADKEIEAVRSLCPRLGLTTSTPTRLKKANVLAELRGCTLFHFSGHGESKEDPSKSTVLLEDWEKDPLTVDDVRKLSWREEFPFLAYLSACSTGANLHWLLRDEGIHLISAFQLAGFRHVVGTLWSVWDAPSVRVAEIVYGTLAKKGQTDEAISLGLHLALRELRDGSPAGSTVREVVKEERTQGGHTGKKTTMNTQWIPYVHYGA